MASCCSPHAAPDGVCDRPILRARGLSKRFRGVRAVEGVDVDIREGEVLGIVGPNGAGKSTLLGLIAGDLPADAGSVELTGRLVGGWPAQRRVALGLGLVSQSGGLFDDLSVAENVRAGAHLLGRTGFVAAALRLSAVRREEQEIAAHVHAVLERVGLAHVADRPVGELSFGTRRLVAVARALAARPRVLLLDEPAAGLDRAEKGELARVLAETARTCALAVIDHDMRFVFALADRVLVLVNGRVLACGAPAAVRADERVIAAYLGAARPVTEPQRGGAC